MSEQSEFWHWKHLERWQSWSHLFRSQNSSFGFSALLMMMKKPPVCGLGCWHRWLLVLLLWEKTVQSTLLSRAGSEGCVPPQEPCRVPQEPRAAQVSPALGHELPFQGQAVTVISCVPFALLTSMLHMQVLNEIMSLIFLPLKTNSWEIQQANRCGLGCFWWVPSGCVFVLLKQCHQVSAGVFFSQRNILYFQCSLCLITR